MSYRTSSILLKTIFGGTMILISYGAFAASVAAMKACEIAVLDKSDFSDLPMAAVSVYPGSKENHAHFTVRWDGLRADGHCKVSGSYVIKVKVNKFHDGRSRNSEENEWAHSGDLDGFYWDRHQAQWRDPHGRTCYTCTPENGFPDRSRHSYHDYNSNDHFEQQMLKDITNSLSSDDIRALNSLGRR